MGKAGIKFHFLQKKIGERDKIKRHGKPTTLINFAPLTNECYKLMEPDTLTCSGNKAGWKGPTYKARGCFSHSIM